MEWLQKPTMEKIGEIAGVSRTTVDRVLKGKSNVSSKAKERVEKAIKELNYIPNKYASILSYNKLFRLAVLIPKSNSEEYYGYVKEGIEKGFLQAAYSKSEMNYFEYEPFNKTSFKEQCDKLLDYHPTCLIIGASVELEPLKIFINKIEKIKIPYSLLDSYYSEFKHVSFFGQDAKASGKFAAKIIKMDFPEEILIIENNTDAAIVNQQKLRKSGFIEEIIKSNYISIKCLNVNININLNKIFKENINIKKKSTIITFNSFIGNIADFISESNLDKSKLSLAGYEGNKKNINHVKEGNVKFLFAQQPREQGFYCFNSILRHYIYKETQEKFNFFPIILLMKENVQFYSQ